jgi:hypothetical protein
MIIFNTDKRDRGMLPIHHEKLVSPFVELLSFRNAARSEHDMPETELRFIYELQIPPQQQRLIF